jgi:hypothetical protein
VRRPPPIAAALAAVLLAASPAGESVQTTVLLTLEPGEQVVDLVASQDLAHWLSVTTFDDRGAGTGGDADDKLGARRVHADGTFLGTFGHVPTSSVVFHPQDGRAAFATVTWGKKGFGKYQIVLDGQPLGDPAHYSEQVEVGGGPGPWFSPDGDRLVWLGNWKSGQYVVTDGKIKKGSGHDALKAQAPWTSDGALVLVARDDDVESLLVDGQVVASAERIELVASRDSGALTWVERGPQGERFVEGGAAGPAFDRIGDAACAAHACAYAARDHEGRWHVVHGDARQGPWLSADSITFSPQGDRLAYRAETAAGWRLVLDGEAGEAFVAIEAFVLLGGGRAFMIARNGARRVLLERRAGADQWTELGRFQRVFALVPGPGGAIAAPVLEAGRVRLFVRDRLLAPAGDDLRPCTVAFSASGAHVAAVLEVDGRDVVTLDGGVVGSWDAVVCPVRFEGEVLRFVAWEGAQLLSAGTDALHDWSDQ